MKQNRQAFVSKTINICVDFAIAHGAVVFCFIYFLRLRRYSVLPTTFNKNLSGTKRFLFGTVLIKKKHRNKGELRVRLEI